MNQIPITPNQPLYVTLADPEGDSHTLYDFDLNIGRYQTTDGRILALPRTAVILLNNLGLQPGEEVQITKIRPGMTSEWSICLSTRAEQARAAAESTATLTEQLSASFQASGARQAIVAPAIPVRTLRKEVPPGPIPANVATREILQFIELDPNTKNWSDQAKQDLCSTILIGFLKAKQIGLWERTGNA